MTDPRPLAERVRESVQQIKRMRYVPDFKAQGHDDGCGAHHFEPCDCYSGTIRAVTLGFEEQMKIARARAALEARKDQP